MKRGISGVYRITNIINGKFYIGASVDIDMRYTTHMGRDARRYVNHPFYKDIREFGKENFEIDVLEFCEREKLLEREQFYYDELHPEYNLVRPAENNFLYKEVQEKASKNSNTPYHVKKRKELYNTPEYKEYFRRVHTTQMKPVEMLLNGEILKSFISLQEAARYISDATEYKGKNKTSKIKAVCDGERKTAYGYKWRYSKVERLSS